MAGYDKLAAMIGAQRSLAIFRRFSTLNVKSLLYMQAELMHLEGELADIVKEDMTSGEADREPFTWSVWHLKESINRPGRSEQWQKALDIRAKLKDYSEHTLDGAVLDMLPNSGIHI